MNAKNLINEAISIHTVKVHDLTDAEAEAAGGYDVEPGFPVRRAEIPGKVFLDFEENKTGIWILQIQTTPQFRNRGYATTLLNWVHQKARKSNQKIYHGVYTDDGEKYLKPINLRLGSE